MITFKNVIHEKIDRVSMGSCLGPTLTSIAMTEFLIIKVADSLFKDGLLKFYICYVDDTLSWQISWWCCTLFRFKHYW